MKTLLTHEWLAPIGGSENVFEELTTLLPDADRACLWNDAPERFGPVRESWLARTPVRRSKALALPLMPSAWKRLDIGTYDRVVASSHAFGHQLAARAARKGKLAYSYVHSPARYVWTPEFDHRGQSPWVRAASGALRSADRRRTDAEVSYAANSDFVRERIESCWGRAATVIYPPVDVEGIQAGIGPDPHVPDHDAAVLDGLPDEFVFGASRFVRYKRLDLAITVGEALGLPVVLAGSGPDEQDLRDRAADSAVPVQFVGRVSTPLLMELYRRAALFAFLAIEDFGIMPAEAIALGTPVLVNRVGGAAEIVALTGGGRTCDPEDDVDCIDAAKAALSLDMAAAVDQVRTFSRAAFRERVDLWLDH